MEQCKIDRINDLARKAKSPQGLTEAETAERDALRLEYVAAFRGSLESRLERIVIQAPDGARRKLRRREERPPAEP